MEEIIIAALRASLGSASALTLLARVESLLAESSSACARGEMDDLIDKWAAEVIGVDRCEVERLQRQLSQLGDLP